MKLAQFLSLFMLSTPALASGVITCGDVMAVGDEASYTLHAEAQKRAQTAIEEFVGKRVVKPHVDATGSNANPETMASLIEVFWCETADTPLHSAYYRFYSSNKSVFE
ncbi:hypothetical protein [Idiomarina aminovorans]|uniref:hypothetical protein n=1 Tax=Idiomarina aminovorans TaxID=2914829 RepID=UPI002005CB86|nr:hypothetical protein [Idiomarina sp. ATCH4]MCK7460478.1 hypothetical protein [Idiomarina sp. ATCH4]